MTLSAPVCWVYRHGPSPAVNCACSAAAAASPLAPTGTDMVGEYAAAMLTPSKSSKPAAAAQARSARTSAGLFAATARSASSALRCSRCGSKAPAEP